MKVNLYIYIDEIAHKLEVFKDEQISVTSTAKNLSDITKIYADYSKTFTIPASKKNNQILSHWYENAVEDGFDQRIKAKGYIEIDTITFREGLWQIEAASVKENKIQSYSLTFFGELKTLVDIIGENEIRDLDFTDIITSFGDDDVLDLVKGDSPTGPVLFPLIANEKKWFFSLSTVEDDSNIRQDDTINKFNLPPAVNVDKIFDAIQTDFGLTFSGSFLNSERFKRLYLYFKNEEEYVTLQKPKRIDFSTASGSGTTPIIFTENDDFFEYKSFEVDAFNSEVVLNIEPDDFMDIPYYVSVFRGSSIANAIPILTFDGLGIESFTIIEEDTPATQPAGSGTIGIGTGNNEGVYFIQISSEIGNDFEGTLVYTGQTLAGTPINKTIVIPYQSIAEQYDFNKIAPRIKIIDFLSGLIKMFNLIIIPLSETSYRLETLDTFYQLGKIRNLTKYSDTSNKIERVKVYNEINFQYQKSGTIVNTRFRDLMTRGYDYADLKASFDGDGGEFSVELPFETLLFNELKYVTGTSIISTNILMGFNITPDEKPYKNKPILLYRDSVKTATDMFSFGIANIQTYVAFGNQTKIGTSMFSLNFGIENSIDTNQPIFNSLYQNFYSSYLENIFNKKARIIKIKMRLPLSILTELKINDRIILRDKRYLINNFTNELTTGETDFELIQDLRSVILFNRDTKETFDAQTNVIDATGLPDDVTFVPIINDNQYGLRLPTETEWNNERLSWGSNDSAGAFASPLKLPMAGRRSSSDGSLNNVGSDGYYWSSTVSGTSADYLRFDSGDAEMGNGIRSDGLSVRLIVNGTFTLQEFEDDYENETFEFQGLTYGFVYNSTTEKIWLDKNLGALQVTISSTDSDSYGDLYQWGRSPEGHQIRTSDLHDGDVDGKPALAKESGDWNSKFITTETSPDDWLDPQDDNLWQGLSGFVESFYFNFSTLVFDPDNNEITITVTENTSANTRIDKYEIVQDGLTIQAFYVIQEGT